MRIALNGWFAHAPATGSGQYLACLVDALAQQYPTASWVVLHPQALPPAWGAWAADVQTVAIPCATHALGKVWWEQITVSRAARRLNADLLHVPYWAPPAFASQPLVVTIFDLIPLLLPQYRGGAAVRLYTALVRATTSRATRVLTDSQAARRDILRHLRLKPARVRAIPLAAGPAYTPVPAPRDTDVLQAHGVEPGYLLYLGGFDVRKNMRVLFAAFAQVVAALPEARLVVAGKLPSADSDFAPDPRRLARAAGVPDSAVCFLGFVPEADKPAIYRGARGFLFLSMYEGFGLPPLEALACGIPVVSSSAASLPEVVGNGGVLVPPTDVAGAASALKRLLRDDAFHADLRARALAQAANFSWSRTAQATWEVYQDSLMKF